MCFMCMSEQRVTYYVKLMQEMDHRGGFFQLDHDSKRIKSP